ncbi:MAG: hypothetical protein GX996_02505 [Firmicutes bacterium]|nr:hypothetical protein [Bacillota bacterium]
MGNKKVIKIENNNSYLLCSQKIDDYSNCIKIYDYKFQYNNNTAIFKKQSGKEIIVFGKLINSHQHEQKDEEIVLDLLKSNNLSDLINRSRKLAGRFIIIFFSREGFFVIPDATASIHVAYTTHGENLHVSSTPKVIADLNGWKESSLSKKIKTFAAETHPLPYDMSMYDEIKYVIPNHYLDCKKRKACRFYPVTKEKNVSVEKAAKISSEIINNIIMGYHERFKLSLPLTSGIDSRTILSVCKNIISDIPIYTFFHDNFTAKTADIYIPK